MAFLLWIAPVALPAKTVVAWLATVSTALLFRRTSSFTLDAGALMAVTASAAMAGVAAGWVRTAGLRPAALPWGLLAAGVFSALLGLLQYYGLAEPLIPWTTAPDLGQAYGNLRQRNQFATLISMSLIAALWMPTAASSSGTTSST